MQELLKPGATRGLEIPWAEVFTLLNDNNQVDDAHLPDTGVSLAQEKAHSSIFMNRYELAGAPFGTRSQTVIAVCRSGHAELRERYLVDSLTETWEEVHLQFEIKLQPHRATQSQALYQEQL